MPVSRTSKRSWCWLAVRRALARRLDLAALGELHRVVDQVGQHLAQAHRVAAAGRRTSRSSQVQQSQALGSCPASISCMTLRAGREVERRVSSSSLPASIFEKSRMSLMMRSSCCDDARPCAPSSCWSGEARAQQQVGSSARCRSSACGSRGSSWRGTPPWPGPPPPRAPSLPCAGGRWCWWRRRLGVEGRLPPLARPAAICALPPPRPSAATHPPHHPGRHHEHHPDRRPRPPPRRFLPARAEQRRRRRRRGGANGRPTTRHQPADHATPPLHKTPACLKLKPSFSRLLLSEVALDQVHAALPPLSPRRCGRSPAGPGGARDRWRRAHRVAQRAGIRLVRTAPTGAGSRAATATAANRRPASARTGSGRTARRPAPVVRRTGAA